MGVLGLASAICVVLCSATAMAALPPQYQRLAELRAILNDSKVVGAFTGQSEGRALVISGMLFGIEICRTLA